MIRIQPRLFNPALDRTVTKISRADVSTVAYGGGVNGTAMILKMIRLGIRFDIVTFADTGGERPETYEHVVRMSNYMVQNGCPPIVVVVAKTKDKTLEDQCIRLGTFPSLAYGNKTCSLKWKREPQDRYLNALARIIRARSKGKKVYKAIGFDVTEQRRVKPSDTDWEFWYPLIEWRMDRDSCIKEILDAGMPVPPKSSCFFCPATRKEELVKLQLSHPDLAARAVALEKRVLSGEGEGLFKTDPARTPGLGRNWNWGEFLGKVDLCSFDLSNIEDEYTEFTPCECMD